MNENIVSIIIPIYNAEKYLNNCINSVINQTYKQIEVLLINDGSTDSTIDILNEYQKKDKRVKVITQKNSGVSVARNNGIKHATGKYIMFIDSDDWIENTFVEQMVNKIKKENVDVVRCSYYNEYNNYTEKENMYDLSNKRVSKEKIYNSSIQSHFLYNKKGLNNYIMLLIIKANVIKNKIEFDKELYMMEDLYFYQQLLSSVNSIYFFDKALYHYNKTNISATRDVKRVEKNIFGILDTNKKLKDFFKAKKIHVLEPDLNACHINLIISYLDKLLKVKDYDTIKNTILNLYQDKKFNIIINNCNLNYFKIFRRIIAMQLKKRKIKSVILLLKIKNIIRK